MEYIEEQLTQVVTKAPVAEYGDAATFRAADGYLLHATYADDKLHGVSIRKGNEPMVFVPAADIKSAK